jgi:hypothetical protein
VRTCLAVTSIFSLVAYRFMLLNRSNDFSAGEGVDYHGSISAPVSDESLQRGAARGRTNVYGEGAL